MRTDGDFVIFVLQARSTIGQEKKWFSPNYDTFGTPPDFTASGDCWQTLGIHGTFDEEKGLDALRLMNREHPEYDWKLMERRLSQHHREIATMAAKNPGVKSPYYTMSGTAEDKECSRRARAVNKG
jgi:hypothetical protein